MQGDTQLQASLASTVAQSFASNSSIMGVIGPAGSDEVQAAAPILKKAGLAFASGSATRVSLTGGAFKGYFFRDVPNDGVQGPTDANYMIKTLGVKAGDTVMIVDDQESYSTGLADIAGAALTAAGRQGRPRVGQPEGHRLLVARRQGHVQRRRSCSCRSRSRRRLSSSRSRLKAQGKSAIIFGSDGTFDSKNFTAGNYVSFFAPDVTTIAADNVDRGCVQQGVPGRHEPVRRAELRARRRCTRRRRRRRARRARARSPGRRCARRSRRSR